MTKKMVLAMVLITVLLAGSVAAVLIGVPGLFEKSKLPILEYEKIKDLPMLTPQIDGGVRYVEGETLLNVAFGKNEDEFACRVNEDNPYEIFGPMSFAVDGTDRVFVYDAENGKLKTFENGKMVDSLECFSPDGWSYGFRQMFFYDGYVYASNIAAASAQGIYKLGDGNVELVDCFGELGEIKSMRYLGNGSFIVTDLYLGNARTQIFNVDCTLEGGETQGLVVSAPKKRFTDKEGNTVEWDSLGYMSYVFMIKNENGDINYAANFRGYDGDVPPNGADAEGNGWQVSLDIIGADGEGRVYMEYTVARFEAWNAVQNDYLLRLDIRENTVEAIEVPNLNEETADGVSFVTGLWTSTTVLSDGTVVMGGADLETGVSVNGYTFD
ncbi:MAG: hypothetical protein IKM04_02655 [Clostridia bacterium]|nr:hypothetical protein [Clostridia bacterium]